MHISKMFTACQASCKYDPRFIAVFLGQFEGLQFVCAIYKCPLTATSQNQLTREWACPKNIEGNRDASFLLELPIALLGVTIQGVSAHNSSRRNQKTS